MKTTRLWKMVNKRFCKKTRNAAKEETGVAMIAVVMFMLIVGLTIAIITSVLLATLGPFRSSKLRSEGAYAAEAGLQTGLNYLRQLEADTTSDALFPAACGSSENTKFCQSTVNNTDIAKASTTEPSVAPNSSGTTFVSQTDSLKYEVQIAFFSGDPDNTPKQSDGTGGNTLTKDAKKNEAKYAVVVSRAIDSKGKVVRAMSGTYGFGENGKNNPSGSGRVGSPFAIATQVRSVSRMAQQPLYPSFNAQGLYDSTTDSMKTDVSFDLTNDDNGKLNPEGTQFTDGDRTMHPGNRTCIIASSYGEKTDQATIDSISSFDDLFNKNMPPSDGSNIFIFTQAYKVSGATWQFTPYCQPSYAQFNSFSYEEDGSIILANGSQNLCVTGYTVDETEKNNYGAYEARLRECKTDKLKNMQLWSFDERFVNAQYAIDNNGKKETPDILGQINDKTYVQSISTTNKLGGYSPNNFVGTLEEVKKRLGNHINSEASDHAAGGNINDGGSVFALSIRNWSLGLGGSDLTPASDSQDIGESLGRGGPALQIDSNGERHHIVNAETGLCLKRIDGSYEFNEYNIKGNSEFILGNCTANVGLFYPSCWRPYMRAQSNKYANVTSATHDGCPSGYQSYSNDDPNSPNKRAEAAYYDSSKAMDDYLTYKEVTDSTSAQSVNIKFSYDGHSFNAYRVNDTKNNKFRFQDSDSDTANCLTMIKPGYKVNGSYIYNRFGSNWIRMAAYADWLPCGAEITDYYGRSVEDAQTWNGADNNSKGGGGGGGGSQKATETSNGYNYVKELSTDANVTWK